MTPEEPERLPAEHVGMNVKHGLTGIPIGVEDNPIPALEDPLSLGNLTSSSDNITQQLRITSRKLPEVPIPLLGHNQHMNPRLRPNIPKSKGIFILIHDISRNLPTNDPLEQRLLVTHGVHPIRPS